MSGTNDWGTNQLANDADGLADGERLNGLTTTFSTEKSKIDFKAIEKVNNNFQAFVELA